MDGLAPRDLCTHSKSLRMLGATFSTARGRAGHNQPGQSGGLGSTGPSTPKAPSAASDTAALASGGAINVIGGVTNGVLSFVFTWIIARTLHASGAGAFYVAVGVFSILSLVSQLGASSAIVRNISSQRTLGHVEDLRPTILIAVVPGFALSCVLGVLMLALAPELSRLLAGQGDRGTIAEYLRIFALALPLATATSVILGATRGFGGMRPSAVIDLIVKPASRVGLAILLLLFLQLGHDVVAVSMTWVIPVALTFVLALVAYAIFCEKTLAVSTTWRCPSEVITYAS